MTLPAIVCLVRKPNFFSFCLESQHRKCERNKRSALKIIAQCLCKVSDYKFQHSENNTETAYFDFVAIVGRIKDNSVTRGTCSVASDDRPDQ